ncbi:hypothetical protein GCM10022423_00890 [Flavobacterium ginsengiterrae]|uniref:Uncharacterized protein n=1 Tax=Flavobacterium ginsengiterrae TaxID=871695 RepID=A0ABP7G5D7_9FLAO
MPEFGNLLQGMQLSDALVEVVSKGAELLSKPDEFEHTFIERGVTVFDRNGFMQQAVSEVFTHLSAGGRLASSFQCRIFGRGKAHCRNTGSV